MCEHPSMQEFSANSTWLGNFHKHVLGYIIVMFIILVYYYISHILVLFFLYVHHHTLFIFKGQTMCE